MVSITFSSPSRCPLVPRVYGPLPHRESRPRSRQGEEGHGSWRWWWWRWCGRYVRWRCSAEAFDRWGVPVRPCGELASAAEPSPAHAVPGVLAGSPGGGRHAGGSSLAGRFCFVCRDRVDKDLPRAWRLRWMDAIARSLFLVPRALCSSSLFLFRADILPAYYNSVPPYMYSSTYYIDNIVDGEVDPPLLVWCLVCCDLCRLYLC